MGLAAGLTGERPVMSLMTMKSVLAKLPADRFKRIHRSYIVPVPKIRSVVNRKVKLDTIDLPIGYSYLQEVSTWLNKYPIIATRRKLTTYYLPPTTYICFFIFPSSSPSSFVPVNKY